MACWAAGTKEALGYDFGTAVVKAEADENKEVDNAVFVVVVAAAVVDVVGLASDFLNPLVRPFNALSTLFTSLPPLDRSEWCLPGRVLRNPKSPGGTTSAGLPSF